MDIDRIIDRAVNEAKKGVKQEINADFTQDQNLKNLSISELCLSEIISDDIKIELYKRFKVDAENYIESFVKSPRCKDVNKSHGMFKCSHETWMACIKEFGIDYFMQNKYMHDIKREKWEGGFRLRDDLLFIGLEVYEYLTDLYRKVFQIKDCCDFLGISKENMYKLNDLHSSFLKNMHTSTEHSLRIGALTGRGNVTGHAIILNHDYDYTRTTQVIHTNSNQGIRANDLPQLESTQDIVVSDVSTDGGFLSDSL